MASGRSAAVSDPSSSKSSPASHQKKSKRPQHKKHPPPPPQSSNALPGVQKLKAAIRQTRRLLAKDSLAADVRVQTERRLKSLEGDLARAEQARLERTMATRYHKVKFFERQKVTRKIGQTKKQLASEEVGKKERKKLEARLEELRVDLNYIIHYPKTKKYISLFPPEVRHGHGTERDAQKEKEASETDRQREEVRTWVREQMGTGALSREPEVELGRAEKREVDMQVGSRQTKTDPKRATQASSKSADGGVADDDFFAGDSDEEGSANDEEDSEMDED